MRIREQEDGPAHADDFELIKALHLAGSGRVRALVDERTLSLERKSGHALDLKLTNISRVHHHHTRLVPFSFALLGAGLIYAAQRIFIPNGLQMASGVCGVALVLGWLGTRKPTLTIDTEAGDCHTITGNDASLMRLATLLKRLEGGMCLEDARIGLDILERDAEYPRTAIRELQEVPIQPIHLDPPTSISTFLADTPAEKTATPTGYSTALFSDELDLDFGDPEGFSGGWLDREVIPKTAVVSEHGFISRGIANAHQARGAPSQNTHQPTQHYTTQPHSPIPTAAQSRPVSSFQHIAQSTDVELPHQPHSMHTTTGPQKFIPNFFGPEGVHIPEKTMTQQSLGNTDSPDAFRSPDTMLLEEENEPASSLIERARREAPPPPEQATRTSMASRPQSSRLRPKSANRPGTRLRPKTRRRNHSVGRFTDMVRPAAAQMFGNATELASRLLTPRTSPLTNDESSSTRELRQRSARTLQSESIESILNLSISRGGHLPDDEIMLMLAHMERVSAVMEQDEQNQLDLPSTPALDTMSFEKLKDSKTHHAETAGEGGLPRLDV